MNRGVLLFCFDTEHTKYHKILEKCVGLIKKNLKLAYGNDTISSLIKQFEKKLKNEKMLQYIISRDNPQNSELCL